MSTTTRDRLLTVAWLGVLCITAAGRVRAQETVRGVVMDAATQRPVVGAIVRVAAGAAQQQTRTDETGGFALFRVPLGPAVVDVRRLGYEQVRRSITVVAGDSAALTIILSRITALDTVRVRAARQGLFGVVGTAHDLRPLPNARVSVVGVAAGIALDSSAHFYVPVRAVGTYVLRAAAPGFQPQTISVVVEPDDAVEVAFLLDSTTNRVSHRLEIAFADFDLRVKVRRLASAIVPRSELLRRPGADLVGAIQLSRSFGQRTLRFGQVACVFVDGIPRAISLNAIAPEEVEAVEVYGPQGDASGTLAARWRGLPCGDTGLPRVAPGRDVVRWVVIWLKH